MGLEPDERTRDVVIGRIDTHLADLDKADERPEGLDPSLPTGEFTADQARPIDAELPEAGRGRGVAARRALRRALGWSATCPRSIRRGSQPLASPRVSEPR